MTLHRLLSTDRSTTTFVHRAVLGAVLLPHGLQKLLGWFGGYGFDGTMAYLTAHVGLPAPLALLVILGESLGAIALVLGLGTRLAAAGAAAIMVGAVVTTHLPYGFFMDWAGARGGEGFEYHLLALALATPLMVRGGGRWSLDGAIARAWVRRPSATAPRALAA